MIKKVKGTHHKKRHGSIVEGKEEEGGRQPSFDEGVKNTLALESSHDFNVNQPIQYIE